MDECRWSPHACVISRFGSADRGLSVLGRYCSMGGSRRSDRAEQVSAASWGIGTRRSRVNPVRCRETRHVDGRPGAEVDEVKKCGGGEGWRHGGMVWILYCRRKRERARATRALHTGNGNCQGMGPAGARALKQDLKRGGTFLAREAGCVVCVGCVAGVQILAFQAGQRPELGAASGQSRSLCRGAVSGARNKECEGGAGDVGRAGGVRNGRNGQGLVHFSNHSTTDTFPSLSAIDRVVEVLFLQTIRCRQ